MGFFKSNKKPKYQADRNTVIMFYGKTYTVQQFADAFSGGDTENAIGAMSILLNNGKAKLYEQNTNRYNTNVCSKDCYNKDGFDSKGRLSEYIFDKKEISKQEFISQFNLTDKSEDVIDNMIDQMVNSGLLKRIQYYHDGSNNKLTREAIIKQYNLSGQSAEFIDTFIKGLDSSNNVEKEPTSARPSQTDTREAFNTNTVGYNGKSTVKSRFIWDLNKVKVNELDDLDSMNQYDQFLYQGSRFYLTYYICPCCHKRLLYKTNTTSDFTVVSGFENINVTSVFTCGPCKSFYASKPNKKLADGDGFKIEH